MQCSLINLVHVHANQCKRFLSWIALRLAPFHIWTMYKFYMIIIIILLFYHCYYY